MSCLRCNMLGLSELLFMILLVAVNRPTSRCSRYYEMDVTRHDTTRRYALPAKSLTNINITQYYYPVEFIIHKTL